MRKLAIALLSSTLMFAGCSTIGGGPPDIQSVISQVVQGCQQACGFVPTVQTIEAIFNASDPALATVNAIITQICNLVNSIPTTQMSNAIHKRNTLNIVINGKPVVVHGTFVTGANAGKAI